MEIRQLKYFVTIVEEGKISDAARRLHMSQPPLSLQLKLLEEELGTLLFERHTRKLIITEEGKLLYERAKEILDLIAGTFEEIKGMAEGVTGTLSIGTIPTLSSKLLPEQIRSFQEHYPDVQFQIWEGDPNRIMELVGNRIVEIGIVRLPVDHDVFNMVHLPDEPIVVVANLKRDLGYETNIPLSKLQDKPLMLLRRQKGTSLYNQELYISDMVQNACLKAGFVPKVKCESNDLLTLLNWANHDIGIAVVPQSAVHLIPNANLQVKKIISPSIMARPSALIWLKGRYLSRTSKLFIELFRNNTLD